MRSNIKALCLSAFVVAGMVGCASVEQTPGAGEQPATQQDTRRGKPVSAPTPTPGLSSQDRFRLILELLEQGNSAKAMAELEAYLVQRPGSRIAKGLVAQLEAAPGSMFPAESFPVTLASGESLSTLARDYLGDLYLFYALARYNDIAVPRNIKIGQTINIPATASALAHRDALASGTAPVAQPDVEPAAIDEPEELAETDPEPAPEAPAEPLTPTQMLVAAFTAAAESGDYTEVVAVTSQHSAALAADDWELLRDAYTSSGEALSASDPTTASQLYTSAATLMADQGQNEAALQLLQQAVPLDAANEQASAMMQNISSSLVDGYHREASAAFRAQELEKAITLWDKVLALDPEHSNALVYRAQALELQDRLSNLKD